MKLCAPQNRRGFTLIEVAVVVGLVLILTAIGIDMSRDLIPRYRTKKAAQQLAAHVNQCRMIAIRANRECMIWMKEGDDDLSDTTSNSGTYWMAMGNKSSGSGSWDYLPPDADGTDNDQSQSVVDLSDDDSAYYARYVGIDYTSGDLAGPGSGNADRIIFSPRGYVINPDDDFGSSGYITITFVNKLARSKGLNEDFWISVSRSGMARLDSTGASEFTDMSSGTTSSSSVD